MADIVHLETTLLSSYPNRLKGNLTLVFETEKGKEKEYLEEYFEFITKNKNNIECLNGDK